MRRPLEFVGGAFRNSTLCSDQWGQTPIRSSSWHERNPRTASIIHVDQAVSMPQVVCSHYKQPILLSEHHHQDPHLAEMNSGLLPPATDRTTSAANTKVEWGIHTVDSYKHEHLGPTVVPPSRIPQPPNRGVPRMPPWRPSLPRSQGKCSDYLLLQSWLAYQGRCTAQARSSHLGGDEALVESCRTMGWDPTVAISRTVFAGSVKDGRRWMGEWQRHSRVYAEPIPRNERGNLTTLFEYKYIEYID
jgi:hypothetical protein